MFQNQAQTQIDQTQTQTGQSTDQQTDQTQSQTGQSTDQQTDQTQPDENQQVLNSLQYTKDNLVTSGVHLKIEGAEISVAILTAFLGIITVCRYLVRRRRIAKIAKSLS